jgi:hypothetical protein
MCRRDSLDLLDDVHSTSEFFGCEKTMSAVNFDNLWETVKMLTPSQQRRLRRLLDALRFKQPPFSPEDELNLLLLKDGVIDRILSQPTEADNKVFDEYIPVPFDGKPLSETIIEERR